MHDDDTLDELVDDFEADDSEVNAGETDVTRNAHSLSETYDAFVRLLDQAHVRSGPLLEAMFAAERIDQAFGDKDELIATLAADLKAQLFTHMRELCAKPSRVSARLITAMEPGHARNAAIAEFIATANDLKSLLTSQH